MNTQFYTRVTQIKEYINNLKDSLIAKDHQSASVIVSKFKNIILKQDAEQYAYECILDSLQSKNQKLQQQLSQLKQQKVQFQQGIQKKKNKGKSIKETKIQFVMTRLNVNLNDCKKLQFKDGTIYSDYNTIYLTSMTNNKYQNYPIYIKQIQTSQIKSNFIHLSWGKEERCNLILKFNHQKDGQKWSICLKFAELIAKNKNKNQSNLFQKEMKQEDKIKQESNKLASILPSNNNNNATISHPNPSHQVSSLNLHLGLNFHKNSPSESMISDRKSHEKAGQKSQQKDKDTERSLVQAMEHSHSKVLNSRYGSRMELKKPAKLNKIRGLSDHLDNNFQLSRLYKNHPRKQSQDIFKTQINQLYHQKILQKIKFRDREDSIRSQSQQIKKSDNKNIDKQMEKSVKLQSLQKKKKEILNQIQSLPSQKQEKQLPFVFDTKVNWTNVHIQQMEEQQKSKSSNNRDSRMSSVANDSGKGKQNDDKKSQRISEKSLQQSPTLPKNLAKNGNYTVPKKVSYNDGYVFNLRQVQKSPQKNQNGKSTLVTFQQDENYENRDYIQAQSKILTESQSGSNEHSNPSTHENHTESEDNNGRAQQLKKGIVVTKCSQNGFWTHEKILYLSQNESELCSRDLKDKKIKKIKLSNIQEVEYKAYYKGIIKHVSKIQEDKCLVIQALAQDNKIKNYEYVGNLAEPLQRFATSLKLFVQYYMKQ